jgi:carbon storage regulator CsrA
MLVLSRKVGEKIWIAPDIWITVCLIDQWGKVRIGISAPRETDVKRGELVEQPPEAK